eukprot:5654364-Pleurochrysis_carterae.AAC.3
MSSEDNSDAMQVEKTDTMEKAEPIESAAAPAAGDEDLLSDPGSIDSEPEAAPAAAEDVTAGLSLEECISEASKHKAQGNTHFKAGEAADACQSYQMGIKYVSKHKEEESVRELFLSLHNNLAATLNQLELWDDAIISATNVLEARAARSHVDPCARPSAPSFTRSLPRASSSSLSRPLCPSCFSLLSPNSSMSFPCSFPALSLFESPHPEATPSPSAPFPPFFISLS